MALGFRFHEVMSGTARRVGEARDREFSFDLVVSGDHALGMLTEVTAQAAGQVRLEGVAAAASAEGTLELSPLWHRRLRYQLRFSGDDGRRYRFDGEKSVTLERHVVGWTTLPGTIRQDDDGAEWGTALLRFDLRRQLVGLLGSFRFGWR
jgi:hypothetical protein